MVAKALGAVFSAKTLTFWIILAAIGFLGFVVIAVVAVAFGEKLESLYQSLLAFLGVAGAGGTTRNVISDGIAPRVPMAIAARTEPLVALGSPTPMSDNPAPLPSLPTPAPVAPTAPPNVPSQPMATIAPFTPPGGSRP